MKTSLKWTIKFIVVAMFVLVAMPQCQEQYNGNSCGGDCCSVYVQLYCGGQYCTIVGNYCGQEIPNGVFTSHWQTASCDQ
jgi:hypothetical protein